MVIIIIIIIITRRARQECLRRDRQYGIRFHEDILSPSALSFTLSMCILFPQVVLHIVFRSGF